MKSIAAFGLLIAFTGCAPAAVPADLLTARSAYDRASHGPAAQLDPADLHAARETLDSAEKSFELEVWEAPEQPVAKSHPFSQGARKVS